MQDEYSLWMLAKCRNQDMIEAARRQARVREKPCEVRRIRCAVRLERQRLRRCYQ